MKQAVVILLVFSLIFTVGCQKKSDVINANAEITTTETSAVETTIVETTAPVNYTFRKTTWEMTKEEVIESEGKSPDEQNDKYLGFYNCDVAGYDTSVIYGFKNGKLNQAAYILNEDHVNDNAYIDDYKNLKKLYTDKYSAPYQDKENWSDDLYKDDPDDYGTAVACGHLSYASIFSNSGDDIIMMLNGDNFDISLSITYYDGTFTDNYEPNNDGI